MFASESFSITSLFVSRERERERETEKENNLFLLDRVFGSFTMETILAIAFGRVVNLQRGEADELTVAAQGIFRNAEKGTVPEARVILSNFPFLIGLLRWKVSSDADLMKSQILLHETALNLVKARREESGSSSGKVGQVTMQIAPCICVTFIVFIMGTVDSEPTPCLTSQI